MRLRALLDVISTEQEYFDGVRRLLDAADFRVLELI